MSLFSSNLRYASFIIHFLSLIALIIGLWKLSDFWITTSIFKLAAILFLIIIMSRTSVGDNEIYYNYLVSSVPAKALGVWSIFFAIRSRWMMSCLLLCVATYLQTIVGIQLFLLIMGTAFIVTLIENKNIKHFIGAIGIYLLGCGWWLWSLFMHTTESAELSLYELFEFRVPHHYFPGSFESREIIIFIILSGASIWLGAKSKSKFIWIFNILIGIGIIMYSVAVEIFHSELFLKTQWFKTSLWTEMWFSILFLSFLERLLLNNKLYNLSQWSIFLGTATLIFLTISQRNPPYEFPWNQIRDAEIELALKCNELTRQSDTFTVPFSNSTFRIWSERNVYVDFKSVLHSPRYLNKWQDRIYQMYGLVIPAIQKNTSDKHIAADRHYYNLTQKDLDQVDADYFITKVSHKLPYPILIENKKWIVYDLR